MKHLNKILGVIVSAVLLMGCTANYSLEPDSIEVVDTSSELTWRLGGIGPTTGDAAYYGKSVQNAIQLAVDEINAAGGINGYQVSFYFQDDEDDPRKAVNTYNTLKDWGMQILEGTVTSDSCAMVSTETYKDRIFQLTPSASSTSVIKGNDNTFQVCYSDVNQGIASADFIAEHELATDIGIIYDSSDLYSAGIYRKFVSEARDLGLNIVAVEKFTVDSKSDFTSQLLDCMDTGAELLFLPVYYNEGTTILTQASQMEYAPIIFGVDGLDGLLDVEDFDVSLAEGVYLLSPFTANATDYATKRFVSNYEERFGETPSQFAADAYDGVYILKAAIEDTELTPAAANEEICDTLIAAILNVNYNGLTGRNMSWSADGEVSKDPKMVRIQGGAYLSIK